MESVAPTLVVLAAGRSSRYGKLKQLDPVGPGREVLLDYAVYDALRAGFGRVVFVIAEGLRGDFEAHLAPMLAAGVDVRFAVQRVTDLPSGMGPEASAGRARPWGTAHAVWCARALVDGPFAVCNADDFYGAHAYAVLAGALRGSSASCLVGYALERTLSEHGGVSRGLIRVDADDQLTGIDEATGLERSTDPDEHRLARGMIHGDQPVTVPTAALVSMNLWGFPLDVLAGLEQLFRQFLQSSPREEQEFYLSQALGDLVQWGATRCQLLRTESSWLGVTFPQDHARVASSLAEFVAKGAYPVPLSAAWTPLIESL